VDYDSKCARRSETLGQRDWSPIKFWIQIKESLQIHTRSDPKSGSLEGRLRPPVVTPEAVPASISGVKQRKSATWHGIPQCIRRNQS
jgi:hypothetical protein